MCGIAGIVSAGPAPDLGSCVERMCDVQAHRGPDGRGYLLAAPGAGARLELDRAPRASNGVAPRVALGHRRLAIIDLAGGAQPMSDPSGRVWISYNGEVYNFAELRERLAAAGYVFRTRSDTEVVLAAYVEWGERFVEELVGMFAIALWDGRDGTLLLVRDRLGIKPLHYADLGDRFLFASELKGVLAAGGVPRDLDLAALDHYLGHDYIAAPRTVYRAVRKLEPGHRMRVRVTDAGFEVSDPVAWWDVPVEHEPGDDDGWCEGLRERVDEATRMRLVAEVPVGAFLSGGVDSSVVVSSMSRAHAEPVRSFSIGFDEGPSELAEARAMAERCGSRHTERVVSQQLLDVLPAIVADHDEPFGDSSAVPTHYLCRETRRSVTVALSGDGGDELFAGYSQYRQALWMSRRVEAVPAPLRRLAGHLPERVPGPAALRRWVRAARRLLPLDAYGRYRFLMARFDLDGRHELWRPELDASLERAARGPLARHFDRHPAAPYLTRMQYTDLKSYLPEDVLTKVDRASMRHSLEVRVPLLDHRVVEYAFRMPPELKLRDGSSKWVLKRAFAERLPPHILARPKSGFGSPVQHWFRGSLGELAADLFATPDPLLRADALRRCLDEHRGGVADWGYRLWNLTVLKMWLDQQGVRS